MHNIPDVLSPGLAVNLATSTILTANCSFDSRCIHRRTIENGPLQWANQITNIYKQNGLIF